MTTGESPVFFRIANCYNHTMTEGVNAEMAYFPLCINLNGADVILLGDGAAAMEKQKILLSFGANIRHFSETVCPEQRKDPSVKLVPRALTEDDLEPRPALVVVADAPHWEKERVSQMCQRRGIPVNVVDEPALCTFFFPSLVTRGALTVAVSTGGKSPGGAAWLRRHLEEHIPDQTEEILEWASVLRQRLRTDYPRADRKNILRQAVAQALSENRVLCEDEILTLIQNSNENP